MAVLEAQGNATLDGILVVGEGQSRLVINQRIIEIFDVPPHLLEEANDEALLKHVTALNRDPEKFLEKVMYLYDHPLETSQDEIELTTGVVLDRYTAPVVGKDGKLYGRIWSFRDITERKKAEEEITRARNDAEAANLAKSEFLSRMSHELRTPMNSILGFAQLFEMGELNPGQKKGINHILRSGKHLLNLINEVLDISRIEAGKFSTSVEPVKLSGVISDAIGMIRQTALEQQINIELLHSPDNHLFVRCDRQRLNQVLLNLLNNAIKYNREAGSVIKIRTELMTARETGITYHRISVIDKGIGISSQDIPKLFKPFERIGLQTTGIEGTGLGLAVVKKLMDAMGGHIGLESMPGEGSTFWIELPHCENLSESYENPGTLAGPDTDKSDRSGTILYIEDNTSNIELVELILLLQRSGIRLVSDIHGMQALPLAIEHSPDIIFLDLNLPDIHGIEVLRLLQSEEKTRSIPVIIISADAMPHQLEKLLQAGAEDYLTKPLDIILLLSIIDKWIE